MYGFQKQGVRNTGWSSAMFPVEKYEKAIEHIWNSTTGTKLSPTDPLQTTVALLFEKDSPHGQSNYIGNCDNISVSRVWAADKNIIVVLEVKYSSTFCAYSESVVEWVEFWGQDEHEVAVGVTQYTFPAEQ